MSYSYLNNLALKINNYSCWYINKKSYRDYLITDICLRTRIEQFCNTLIDIIVTNINIAINNVRGQKNILITIQYTKNLKRIDLNLIRNRIHYYINDLKIKYQIKEVNIIFKIDNNARINANYVSYAMLQDMKKNISYRKLLRHAKLCIQNGAVGCIIEIKGRINGHEITRKDKVILGRINRNTLSNDIQYLKKIHIGKSGCVGIKIWINKGTLE